VANELGAGNGKGAKFATQVSVTQSIAIGVVLCVLIMIFHDYLAYIFTTSSSVLEAVDDMSFLLAITILLNSVQPILSGTHLLLIMIFHISLSSSMESQIPTYMQPNATYSILYVHGIYMCLSIFNKPFSFYFQR